MKIEHNVPVPPEKKQGRPRAYNFEDMQVGDCATIEAHYNTVYACLRRFNELPEYAKWQFRIRKHEETDGVTQVWRLK